MISKIVPLSKYDKNGLDQESILFAKYYFRITFIFIPFLVNNSEIATIRKIYNKILKNSIGRETFKSKLLEIMHNDKLPLFDHLFSVYGISVLISSIIEDSTVDWNSFFQFVVFYSLAPQVAVFYLLFHSFPSFSNHISTSDLTRLLISLRSVHIIIPYTMSLFYKYDLNNDGLLNWNQFFAFASQTPELWETLFVSRINMLKTFFPNEGFKIILNRRKNIKSIKQHQDFNNGSLPHEPCVEFMKRLMKFKPNPFKYDYYCDVEQLSFVPLMKKIVKKYNNNFRFTKQAFAMKFLGAFNSYPVIYEIDKYYVIFRNYIPRKQSLSFYPKDSLLSETSSANSECMNAYNQNRNASKKSILRSSTRVSQARESITQNNLSLYATTGMKRKSNVLITALTSPTMFTNKSNTTITVDIAKEEDDDFY